MFHEQIFPFLSPKTIHTQSDPFQHIVLPHLSNNNNSIPEYDSIPSPISSYDSVVPEFEQLNTLRRTTRVSNPPYLRDFHCNYMSHSVDLDNTSISYTHYPL